MTMTLEAATARCKHNWEAIPLGLDNVDVRAGVGDYCVFMAAELRGVNAKASRQLWVAAYRGRRIGYRYSSDRLARAACERHLSMRQTFKARARADQDD